MAFFVHLIVRFGYFGIFGLLMFGIFGLPLPDETLLTFCGYLVSKGHFSYVPTVLAAFLGSCSGITVSYFIGRKPGLALIHRFGKFLHFDEEKIQRVHTWFERAGKWTLTFGYFVPGFRHLTAIVAGATCLEYPVFAIFAYGGALFWSATFVTLGYFLGERWHSMSDEVHKLLIWGFWGISAAIAVVVVVRWFLRRRAVRRKEEAAAQGNNS